jgi:hypothetical protein
LSWSELFRTQHRVHKIDEQPRTHRQRYDRIKHFPYLNPSQNFTYRTDKAKNTSVEMAKIVSSIAGLPSSLSEHRIAQHGHALCLSCGNLSHRHFNRFATGPSILSFPHEVPDSRLKRYYGQAALRVMGNRVRHDSHFIPVPLSKLRCVFPGIVH